MRYDQLPALPPSYGEHDDSFDLERNERVGQEMHDIEEMDFEEAAQPAESRFTVLKKQFNLKIKEPIIDPMLELYAFLCVKANLYMSKLGNPLIVKRFAYVIFISLIVYLLSLAGVFPQGSGYYSNFGGSFSDRAQLLEYVDTSVNLQKMEENLEYLSSIDHISGTKGDLTLAKFIDTTFRQSDMNVIDFQELRTLLNFPNKSVLVYDDVELDLTEQFMPLSFNGEVTGNLIYAGFGLAKEYELLKSSNVKVEDSIAIVKFDEDFPVSQKILIAQTYGIRGILFISSSDKFPDAFERRSCEIPQFYTGDPLTPGWSTSTMTNRIDFTDAAMAKIPTISMTRNQIAPLLSKLESSGIKLDDFYSGDGTKAEVTFTNNVIYQQDHSIWNILGRIDGKEQSDKALIIGAQRDSPCKGAMYPNSGTTLLLELLELFTKLKVKFNWTPLRSIYFISFDGSEYNFAGVSELIEAKFGEVKRETLTYIDLTDAISGDSLEVKSSSLLNLDEYQEEFNFTLKKTDNYGNFIPFMTEGIPVLEIGYKSKEQITPKYTCQDDFSWFKEHVDGEFKKFEILAKLTMRIILGIIDDPLVPFDVSKYVIDLDSDLHDLQRYCQDKRPNDQFNFNSIIEGLLRLKQIGKDFETWKKAWTDLVDDDSGIEPSLLSVHRWNWNSRLSLFEKVFCESEGISSRSWYKNLLHGPQLFKPEDGDYSWFSYPGIRDAIDRSDHESVQKEIDRVGNIIMAGIGSVIG